MELSDPITFSGGARLLHPTRLPAYLQKKSSHTAFLQIHASFYMSLNIHMDSIARESEFHLSVGQVISEEKLRRQALRL